MNLHTKIAIVTGASSGIGAAFAGSLVAKGVKVYGLGRNVGSLETIEDKLGDAFIPVHMDITDQKKIAKWVADTFSDSHSPDILVNNAGAGFLSKIDELPLEQWHRMINTNLNGIFYITSQVVPFMKRNKGTCHIINIGSILGKIAKAKSSAYCATKFGIQGFSEALYQELRYDKIKVTCLNPGSIETGFFESSGVEPHHNMLQPKDVADILIHILETPDNLLINDITIRPLIPKQPVSVL
jgi:NADP-dependent 3-hydroxy acid dehydrogenase YdfG